MSDNEMYQDDAEVLKEALNGGDDDHNSEQSYLSDLDSTEEGEQKDEGSEKLDRDERREFRAFKRNQKKLSETPIEKKAPTVFVQQVERKEYVSMKANPTKHSVLILETELLKMKRSTDTRDLSRVIDPKQLVSIFKMLKTNKLQTSNDDKQADHWSHWSDKTLITNLRNCIGCTVASKSEGDLDLEAVVDMIHTVHWSALCFDMLNKIDNVVLENLDEETLENESKYTMVVIRQAVFAVLDLCLLGKAMHIKFKAQQLEKMVKTTITSASTTKPPPDYSWNKFMEVVYDLHTEGTQAVVKAQIWGGTDLAQVCKKVGSSKRTLPDATPGKGGGGGANADTKAWRDGLKADARATKKTKLSDTSGEAAAKAAKQALREASVDLKCTACGRPHHLSKDCALKDHRDSNREDVPFAESKMGKRWLSEKSQTTLPFNIGLDGKVNTDIIMKPNANLKPGWGGGLNNTKFGKKKLGGKSHTNSLLQPVTFGCGLCNNITINNNINNVLCHDIHTPVIPYDENGIRTCTLINPTNNCDVPIRLSVLSDTGSLGIGANFISPEASSRLKAAGFKATKVNEKMCSCFVGNCKVVNELFKLRLRFFNEKLGTDVTITVKCRVADIAHDVIIGRNKINNCAHLRELLDLSLNAHGVRDDYESDQELDTVREENLDPGIHDPWSLPVHPTVKGVMVESDKTKSDRVEHDRIKIQNKLIKILINKITGIPEDHHSLNNTTIHESDPSYDYEEPVTFGGPEDLQTEARAICKSHRKIITKHLSQQPADITPMVIELTGEWGGKSDQQPPRHQSRLKADEIEEQTKNMLTAYVITESQAAAHSQVMMTVKANGTWRFCIDYRRLNVVTKPNTFPLPKIQDILDRIGRKGPKYFAVIDLTKGYYQAPLDEKSRHLTAFITPSGKFEWLRVAMGLTGAPSYFQRAMANEVLHGLVGNICEVYLDDIIIYGASKEEFLENLNTVLTRLEEKNVSVNPSKCKIGLTSIEYVGHVIDQDGTHFSKEKISKVLDMARPDTTGELKSFVGVVNYFRDHCKNAAARMAPLNKLLEGYNKKVKVKIKWEKEDEALSAFIDVKQMVNDIQKLFFIDEHSDVHLCTDASKKGIGGYLYQLVDGKEIPIAFYSKSLNAQEKNWGVPELEGYAIFACFRHWDYLLRDAHTHVHTDHKNLVYIRDTGSEKVIRWKMHLQEYSFDVDYLPGVDNPIADYWSRNEAAEVDDYEIESPAHVANMLCQMTLQRNEPETMFVNATKSGKSWQQFNIPETEYELIEAVHNKMTGHHGVTDTLHLLAQQGWKWPYMREHVRRFVKECDLCQKATFRHNKIQIPKYTTGSYLPMERWNLDTIGPFPPDQFGNQYVIVMIDCFSRFITLYPTKTRDADEAAEAVIQQIGHYGVPGQILSDGGGEYVNDIIKELLEMAGTEHVATIAHSHEENSMVERHNAEVSRWLREILYDSKIPVKADTPTDWSKYLPFVQRIHNSKRIGFLGYSPAQMLFGDRVNLDRSILLPPENRPIQAGQEVTAWMQDQRKIQDKILAKAKKLQEEKDKRHLVDNTPEYTVYEDGSYVLQDYPDSGINLGRPNKLHMMRKGPYQVISHSGNLYKVKNLVTEEVETKGIWLLRQFVFDATRTDPKTIALKDHAGTFDVETILSHEGNWSRKTQVKFVVKWEGYEKTTVEPWKNVSQTRAMVTYLTDLKLEKLLPGYIPDPTTKEARKTRKRKLSKNERG